MSQKRQAVFEAVGHSRSQVTTLTHDYSPGHAVPMHFHDRDQLVYASRGVMTVRTRDGTWVVPPNLAVWIPAYVAHTITMSGAVSMRTLYLKRGLARTMPQTCCVVNVSSLLRELILHACTFGTLRRTIKRQLHLIDFINDQLTTFQAVPLQLPNLSDPRAVRITEKLFSDPGNHQTLAQLCRAVGASKRTVERLFLEEAAMTFGKWRQQLRIMHSLTLLAEGAKVTHVALEAGYSTPSAFVAAFKKVLGTTPTSYFRARNSDHLH